MAPNALPDVEVFYLHADDSRNVYQGLIDEDGEPFSEGWYFAFGLPGCLWDSEPFGPYSSHSEALAAAREE